jgi:guanylate kinase
MQPKLVRKGILFVLIGPTGSGKSTFCSRLLADFSDSLRYSVSATSRPMRSGEIQGKSYHFFPRDEFNRKIEGGDFFEWEENHGNLYGTLRSTLIDGINSGRDLLFQIDIRGALKFKRAFPDNTVTVFIIPPSFEALQSRLSSRGTVDPVEVARRFDTARSEYSALVDLYGQSGQIDYLIVNQELDTAYQEIKSVVVSERARYHRMDLPSVKDFCVVGE